MLTFKQFLILVESFEQAKTGKPFSVSGYHYSSTPLIKGVSRRLGKKSHGLYFTDKKGEWASPWMKNPPKEYKLTAKFKNPKVFKKEPRYYEGDISKEIPALKKAGHDGIIYIPNNRVTGGDRQAIHFYPSKGIKLKK